MDSFAFAFPKMTLSICRESLCPKRQRRLDYPNRLGNRKSHETEILLARLSGALPMPFKSIRIRIQRQELAPPRKVGFESRVKTQISPRASEGEMHVAN